MNKTPSQDYGDGEEFRRDVTEHKQSSSTGNISLQNQQLQ